MSLHYSRHEVHSTNKTLLLPEKTAGASDLEERGEDEERSLNMHRSTTEMERKNTPYLLIGTEASEFTLGSKQFKVPKDTVIYTSDGSTSFNKSSSIPDLKLSGKTSSDRPITNKILTASTPVPLLGEDSSNSS